MHKRVFAAMVAAFVFSGALVAGSAAAQPVAASPAPTASAEDAHPAPRIAVPPINVGAWYDLGAYLAPWLASDGPVPVSGPVAPTRVTGWLREADPKDPDSKAEWLALVIVQVAPGGHAPCSTQASSLAVQDADAGCLRLRRDADFDHWMQVAQPVLYRWIDDHGWTSPPRAWVAYRQPSVDNQAVEVHVLFDPSLIEPTLRNTIDFITSGLPGQQWARQLAAAVRAMDGAAGNAFAVPPFPFAPAPRRAPEATLPDVLSTGSPDASAPAAATPSAARPAVAEQLTPPESPEPPPPEDQNPD